MSEHRGVDAVPLGAVDPAGSRHQGRRSAVTVTDHLLVAGTAAGTVVAHDRDSLAERWRFEGSESVVAAQNAHNGIMVGTRGQQGIVRLHDSATGSVRWEHDGVSAVGEAQKDTRFFLPFVAAIDAHGAHSYAAVRRYERGDDGTRHFESVVYAFESDGSVAWRYEVDASPISIDARDGRVAIAYNRCPGDHQHGLVVLDAAAGTPRWRWDPGTDGQRRVGDVSLLDDGAVVCSHGDYCGYRLTERGGEAWRVELATERAIDGETLYAYPNHVHATSAGAVFVTGNTYPADGRQTDVRHPKEHTALGVSLAGDIEWQAAVGGFASGVGTCGSRLAVPGAQNFRDRDAADHGLTVLDVVDGVVEGIPADGIPTAAALDDGGVAFVEEPVVYHDEGVEHGDYRLHQFEA
jgi:outer membrane protein assembly factor BamB